MPTSAVTKFNIFVEDLFHGDHDFSSNTFRVALTNTLPVVTNTIISNITEVSYTYAGNRDLTLNSSGQVSGTYRAIFADKSITATGGAVGPFRYVVIYNTVNNKLVGWADYQSSTTLNDGEVLLLDFNQSLGLISAT